MKTFTTVRAQPSRKPVDRAIRIAACAGDVLAAYSRPAFTAPLTANAGRHQYNPLPRPLEFPTKSPVHHLCGYHVQVILGRGLRSQQQIFTPAVLAIARAPQTAQRYACRFRALFRPPVQIPRRAALRHATKPLHLQVSSGQRSCASYSAALIPGLNSPAASSQSINRASRSTALPFFRALHPARGAKASLAIPARIQSTNGLASSERARTRVSSRAKPQSILSSFRGTFIAAQSHPQRQQLDCVLASTARALRQELHMPLVAIQKHPGPLLHPCHDIIGKATRHGVKPIRCAIALAQVIYMRRRDNYRSRRFVRSTLSRATRRCHLPPRIGFARFLHSAPLSVLAGSLELPRPSATENSTHGFYAGSPYSPFVHQPPLHLLLACAKPDKLYAFGQRPPTIISASFPASLCCSYTYAPRRLWRARCSNKSNHSPFPGSEIP